MFPVNKTRCQSNNCPCEHKNKLTDDQRREEEDVDDADAAHGDERGGVRQREHAHDQHADPRERQVSHQLIRQNRVLLPVQQEVVKREHPQTRYVDTLRRVRTQRVVHLGPGEHPRDDVVQPNGLLINLQLSRVHTRDGHRLKRKHDVSRIA